MSIVKDKMPWIEIYLTLINLNKVRVIDLNPDLEQDEIDAIVFYFDDDQQRKFYSDNCDDNDLPEIKEKIRNLFVEKTGQTGQKEHNPFELISIT